MIEHAHRMLIALFAALAFWPMPGGDTLWAREVDGLQAIAERGVLRVGVRRDAPRWAVLDPTTGAIVGLEADLARDLAARLGVVPELVPLWSVERIEALESGRVDVLLASLTATPERAARVHFVAPAYYASGVSLLARRQAGFGHWSEVRHRRICSTRGSFFNRPLAVEHGADIVALYSADRALAALRDGRCDGLLGDTVVLTAMLRDADLAGDFELRLPPLYLADWAAALPREAGGGSLDAAVSRAVIEWHRDGLLGRLEERWGIPRSEFTRRMETDWRQAAE